MEKQYKMDSVTWKKNFMVWRNATSAFMHHQGTQLPDFMVPR